jgi:DUF1009 family protein
MNDNPSSDFTRFAGCGLALAAIIAALALLIFALAYAGPAVRKLARELGRLDVGQTVVVADGACVAVEAMEGTDAVIDRAASLVNGRSIRVVKLAKPKQDLRFDVPVIGVPTVHVMRRALVTAMAVEARKTLMIDREELLREADAAGISITAVE